MDYAIAFEHIKEDMKAALQLVSDRRPPGTPPLQLEVVPWVNAGPSRGQDGSVSYDMYVKMYEECGDACIRNMENVFRDELRFFGCKAVYS